MKNYKTKELAKEGFLEIIDKAFEKKDKNSYYFNKGESKTFIKLLRKLITSDKISEIKKIIKSPEVQSMRDNRHLYYNSYAWGFSIMGNLSGKDKSDLMFEERLFAFLDKKRIHFLDVSDIPMSDFVKLAKEKDLPLFMSELIYEFLCSKGEFDHAFEVIEPLLKNNLDFTIQSENSEDYWPLLNNKIYKDLRPNTQRKNIENYMEAVNNPTKMFPVNQTVNESALKKFKNLMKKLKVSSFLVTKDSSDAVQGMDRFDILESNPSAVADILDFSNYWETNNLLKSLKETNKTRLEKIIVAYLNREFKDGKKKTKFLRIYNGLKEVDIEIDVFSLDSKLQSTILLEEIN